MKDRYKHQVLDAAQEIHMHVTGASDCVHPDEVKELVEFLKSRLKMWSTPVRPFREFDNAVEAVLRAAIREWEWEREERGRPHDEH